MHIFKSYLPLLLASGATLTAGQACNRRMAIRSAPDHDLFLHLTDNGPRSLQARQDSTDPWRESKPKGPICRSGSSYTVAQCHIDQLKAKGCNVVACVSAGAACFATCASAGAQGGIDALADIACLAAIGTFTAECADCDPRSVGAI
ncbi:hypothetical protein CLAFUW4_20026 [Fulvia fulva]|uniref:uncharacterized protein n=1 Tax=Passalora fulva TaxID=5499 RepID=UPI002852767F|nr:uncharacterized protein CLAFUR5_20026 [Fulvia fulva]KAK4628711.1 hypothetical protein CLAFUR4_20026 [Fulvia fulva]KAK4630168.1 hypothetical protein CLAFUR0_20026 [Fulvia fulva]WMI38826.1 hypothetical protein CLAFUR5_20026 [Fulvia fulva]WPV12187.1 hypothetical protein CLAFUW4_20026 [Fulvia fulva]WPV27887.1 hypothetical protein CLAFUW7_20026 [Fulvia fulva]